MVLEVTEHSDIASYTEIGDIIRPLRDRGVRLAIDDAGAGYSSFRHILALSPDIIKLDMSITRHIDTDASKQAFARSMIAFSRDTGSLILAEGVETSAELRMLESLGVEKAQGYLTGKPMPFRKIIANGYLQD